MLTVLVGYAKRGGEGTTDKKYGGQKDSQLVECLQTLMRLMVGD